MFTRFKKERKKLFLDPLFDEKLIHKTGEKIELILSPAFYWVKKMKLPIKNTREAKKLLPSIFEDLLLEGNYSYHSYKSGDEFLLFAYEEKKILEFLNKKGVLFGDIGAVHFAQSLSAFLETPKSINEKQVLLVQDDIVLLLPLSWVESSEPLEIDGMRLSNNTIRLQQFGHIVDNSSLKKIGIVLSSLAFLFTIEIFISKTKKEEVSIAKENIFTHYNLQPTLMQNNSSLEKYAKIHLEQKNLRETIATFLSLPLQKEQKIIQMNYKNKQLNITINNVTQKSAESIKKLLREKGVLFKGTHTQEKLKLEVAL